MPPNCLPLSIKACRACFGKVDYVIKQCVIWAYGIYKTAGISRGSHSWMYSTSDAIVKMYFFYIFTRGQFWPSGIVIAPVCVSVSVCVCVCINHLLVRERPIFTVNRKGACVYHE